MIIQPNSLVRHRITTYLLLLIIGILGGVLFTNIRSLQSLKQSPVTSLVMYPSPTTTLISLSQWHTYYDKDAGFTLSFPPNWHVLPQPNGPFTITTADFATHPSNGVVIRGARLIILPDQPFSEDDPALTIWSKMHFNLDKDYAYRYIVSISGAGFGDIVYVIHNNIQYQIQMYYDYERKAEFQQLFDTILATFIFLA